MPTLIRHDHPPPHAHAFTAGAVMKIDLSTCMVTEVVGRISDRDVRRAERLVADNIEALQQAWERLHGQE